MDGPLTSACGGLHFKLDRELAKHSANPGPKRQSGKKPLCEIIESHLFGLPQTESATLGLMKGEMAQDLIRFTLCSSLLNRCLCLL